MIPTQQIFAQRTQKNMVITNQYQFSNIVYGVQKSEMFYCSFFPPKVKQNLTVICSKRPFVFLTGNLHVKIKQKLIILGNFQNFRKLKSHAPGPPFRITTLL